MALLVRQRRIILHRFYSITFLYVFRVKWIQPVHKIQPHLIVQTKTNGISSVFIKILDLLRGVNGYHWASYNQKHLRFKGFSTSDLPTYSETFANIVIENMKELFLLFNIDIELRKQWGWNLVYNYNQHNINIV